MCSTTTGRTGRYGPRRHWGNSPRNSARSLAQAAATVPDSGGRTPFPVLAVMAARWPRGGIAPVGGGRDGTSPRGTAARRYTEVRRPRLRPEPDRRIPADRHRSSVGRELRERRAYGTDQRAERFIWLRREPEHFLAEPLGPRELAVERADRCDGGRCR